MKKIILFTIIASLIFSISGCTSAESLPERMPEDFSFYVEWDYPGSSYDSATGILRKKSGEKYVTAYMMSDEELKTVYELIRDMNPESYGDWIGNGLEYQEANPCMDICLTVREGNTLITIEAKDAAGLSSGKSMRAKRYFETVSKIVDILMSTEEWKALPPDPGMYE